MPGLVLLSQPAERLLERAGTGFRDSVSPKVDAKPASGGPVVVEDVRRDEADQFSASAGSSSSSWSAKRKRNRADKHAAWQKRILIWPPRRHLAGIEIRAEDRFLAEPLRGFVA
jgi:hypothetical protein